MQAGCLIDSIFYKPQIFALLVVVWRLRLRMPAAHTLCADHVKYALIRIPRGDAVPIVFGHRDCRALLTLL